ncbi:hypothetical protein BJD55_gp132 [Gordonia phage Yvonnetastic]|uniref:Uncharacterized protein n=1 Tax=Gordonia phage Yvonnetastic TaxID=1821566 RepID=A0A142K951_9CAUD|nr:hypothetical protein BJD55_gp132 [Gordonia phage Yvonnetastic]AMS02634.1 hypothetical protein SEA_YVONNETASTIC_90 [Gordonia phage Yvonnetastic]WKW86066.1 hypothetical protein SEA_JONJAMES_92 [Gordonia Phage JonJames]
MALNVELAERILEQVTKHPEHHDQGIWGTKDDCGTNLCIAGWALVLSGQDAWDPAGITGALILRPKGGGSVRQTAQELLGLGYYAANRLFLESTEVEAVDYLERLIDYERRNS